MILVIRVTDIVRQWEDIRGTGSIDYEIDFCCVTVTRGMQVGIDIGNESDGYRLTVGGYLGDAGMY